MVELMGPGSRYTSLLYLPIKPWFSKAVISKSDNFQILRTFSTEQVCFNRSRNKWTQLDTKHHMNTCVTTEIWACKNSQVVFGKWKWFWEILQRSGKWLVNIWKVRVISELGKGLDRKMIRPVSQADCAVLAEIYNHYILNTTITFEVKASGLHYCSKFYSHS